LTPERIREARERISEDVVLTPCRRSHSFEDVVPGPIYFKLENHQRTGSFKDRGALNRMCSLTEEERARGIVAWSAGNHAQALAFHATRLGIPATVVMPETAPLIKVSKTRRYGARVVLSGATFSDAEREAREIAETEGRTILHAFDDFDVIAGQGTIGLELLEQLPSLDTVLVPIGGGGLISGIAVALKSARPDIRVIGVEAEAAPSARASLDAGSIVHLESAETIADGIAVKRIGSLTFPLIQEWVDEVVVVSEEETAAAILLLLERDKTVAEGAGAVSLAALLSDRVSTREGEVCLPIVSGGNIDVTMVARIIDRGLVFDGRMTRLRITVRDRPGGIASITRIAADAGANVVEVDHRRSFADISVGDVEIELQLETRGRDHVEEIMGRFVSAGLGVEEVV